MYAVMALYCSCGLTYRTKGKHYAYYLAVALIHAFLILPHFITVDSLMLVHISFIFKPFTTLGALMFQCREVDLPMCF